MTSCLVNISFQDCETKCKSQADCKLMTFNTEQNLCQQWSSCDKFSTSVSSRPGPGRSSLSSSSSATTWSMACPFSDPCDIQVSTYMILSDSFGFLLFFGPPFIYAMTILVKLFLYQKYRNFEYCQNDPVYPDSLKLT